MMMKKLVFAAALLSLALLVGCAKGGSGPCAVNCPAIEIEPQINKVGLNVSVPLTLQFNQYATPSPVTWAIQPSSCGSACGTLIDVTSSTATYVGPSTVPSSPSFSIVATSQTDSGLTGSLGLTIIPVTANVAPVSPNVGAGLTQEYTAVALPEQASQTFTWTCTTPNGPCSNFSQDPNISGLAYYKPTAGEECGSAGCVTISAVATVDPTGCTVDPKITCTASQTTVVSSRVPTGTYAFQFSGYDKNGKALALAGTFTVDSGGSVSGFEDESAWNGSKFSTTQRAFSGGSYSPISGSNSNSNNAGTLSLNTGAFPSTYSVVLDGAGDIQMIASDGTGNSGSGVADPSAASKFNQGAGTPATFAFGFTGVDASNNRVGYAGLLQTDGVSAVTGGLIDVNDNGSDSNSVCSAAPPPCKVAGSYVADGTVSNLWHLTLTAPIAMTFDFFVANGSENNNGNNPLYLYAISTDSNPAVVGTMTYQNPKITTYNNAAFAGNSVSALTGANNNVALILTTTFGDNGGSGVSGACTGTGLGSLQGVFDQNNAGTILSVGSFPSPSQTSNPYTYVSLNGNTGRYIFCMLGNPDATTPVLPIPFVMYASGANRGFLLDQSSASVMTGTMNPQSAPKQNGGVFASASAIGTYAVATNSNSAPSESTCASSDSLLTGCSVFMNLLLNEPNTQVYNATGTLNPGSSAFVTPYTVGGSGTGAFAPLPDSKVTTPNYVLYGVTETTFFLIDIDTDKNGPVISPILYMAQ